MLALSRFRTMIVALGTVTGLPVRSGSQVQPVSSTARIPRPIVTARRVFISNAGSESYGAATYDRLTRYDGGPNRLYADFYGAVRAWGRLELVDAPADADLVYAVRFENPIVDRQTADEFVYDPQIQLKITDPKTQILLWSITEHIEPALTRAGDNANFDRAVARLIERLRALTEASTEEAARVIQAPAVPAGVDRARRGHHAGQGALLGLTLAAVVQSQSVLRACTPDPCTRPPVAMRNFLWVDLAAMGLGAVIGWALPIGGP